MSTDTEALVELGYLEEVESQVVPYEDTNDGKDHMAHLINPPMNLHIWRIGMEAQDIVDIARLKSLPVVALCGYKWVPKRNPEKYPACRACFDIAHELMSGKGE